MAEPRAQGFLTRREIKSRKAWKGQRNEISACVSGTGDFSSV